jgi:hypothetical protein
VDEDPVGGPNEFVLKLFFGDLVPAPTARLQLDGYRRVLTRRLLQFESMLRELDEVEHVFPQLVLRRAIVRIRTSLSWAEEVDRAIGEAQDAKDSAGTIDAPTPSQPVT